MIEIETLLEKIKGEKDFFDCDKEVIKSIYEYYIKNETPLGDGLVLDNINCDFKVTHIFQYYGLIDVPFKVIINGGIL
jgi:hypothetical protein